MLGTLLFSGLSTNKPPMSGIGTPRKTPVSPTYKSQPSHEIDTQSPTERDRIMMSPSGQGFDTPQVQFVLKFFDHLSARNLDAAFSLLSDTLVYELWPASLAHGPRTKSEYKALLDTNPDRDVKVWPLECDRVHVLAVLTGVFSSKF